MRSTAHETAENFDKIIDIWLELDCVCDENEDGVEMVEEWLEKQKVEIADFEKNNPDLEAITGDGNFIKYRGKAIDFINAGIDVEIEG